LPRAWRTPPRTWSPGLPRTASSTTVFAGAAPLAERDWTAHVLAALHQQATGGLPILEPLTLPMYERLVSQAVVDLKLQALKITPCSARHGGPSTDAYFGGLDIADIQRRGRWANLRSVRRYEKKGTLQRQLNRMPPHLARHGRRLFEDRSKNGLQQRMCAAARGLRALRRKRPLSAAAWQPPSRRAKGS